MCHLPTGWYNTLFPNLESDDVIQRICIGDILTPLNRITMETEASLLSEIIDTFEKTEWQIAAFHWWLWVRRLAVANSLGSSFCRTSFATNVFTCSRIAAKMRNKFQFWIVALKNAWNICHLFIFIKTHRNRLRTRIVPSGHFLFCRINVLEALKRFHY